MPSPPNIHDLFSRFQMGNEGAFCELYRISYNRLFRYGCVLTAEPKVVEDVIQDLFIWLWENREKTTHIRQAEIYLFQSLKRNLWQKTGESRRPFRISKLVENQDIQDVSQHSIEQTLIESETQEFNRNWVKKQLGNLPQHQQEVIYLRYYEGLNYDEIAEVVNVSNQVARNYAARALKMIRKIARLEELLTIPLFFLIF